MPAQQKLRPCLQFEHQSVKQESKGHYNKINVHSYNYKYHTQYKTSANKKVAFSITASTAVQAVV